MPKLHILGDSISMHYGPYVEKFLAGTAWTYSRKEGPVGSIDHGGGANGGDSAAVLGYLRDCRAAGLRWDLLLVNCGLHDIKTDPATGARQVREDDYRANLQAVTALAPALAGRMAWIRTTHVVDAIHLRHNSAFHRHADDQARYNAIADAVMAAAGITVIDLDRLTRAIGGDEVFCDHVHFTEPVRVTQGAFLAGWLAGEL